MVINDTMKALLFVGCGTLIVAYSYIIMKNAHKRVINNKRLTLYTDIYWLIGVFSWFIGSMMNLVALDYGNQILLSSSSCFVTIYNTILSVVFLGEKLQLIDITAIILMCTGSVIFLTGVSSPETK